MSNQEKETQKDNTFMQLERIKALYFASKYINFKNFIKVTGTQLPDGVEADDLLHWNKEKKDIRDASSTTYKGIKNMYADTLMERLDAMQQINDKVMKMLDGIDNIKDIKTLLQSLETIAKLQDDTIDTLNIDTSSDGEYSKAKTATDDLLHPEDD